MIVWAHDANIGPMAPKRVVVQWLIAGWGLLAVAVLFYVTRVPERWFPGQFDCLGNSHNWFHTVVVVSSCCSLVCATHVRQHDWCKA